MADLTFTRSGELDVTQVESETLLGIEFIDAWMSANIGSKQGRQPQLADPSDGKARAQERADGRT